jgi:hypothetical protein
MKSSRLLVPSARGRLIAQKELSILNIIQCLWFLTHFGQYTIRTDLHHVTEIRCPQLLTPGLLIRIFAISGIDVYRI